MPMPQDVIQKILGYVLGMIRNDDEVEAYVLSEEMWITSAFKISPTVKEQCETYYWKVKQGQLLLIQEVTHCSERGSLRGRCRFQSNGLERQAFLNITNNEGSYTIERAGIALDVLLRRAWH